MRRMLTAVLIVGTGWWLFHDTYIRHSHGQADPNVIRFSHFGPHESYLFWRDVIALFEQSHPDLRVKQEYVVGLGNHYNIKMRQQVLAGALPDVSLIQLGPFRDLADHFADLTALVSTSETGGAIDPDDIDETALRAFRVDGRFRGLPVSGGNLLIYVNGDCFERASRFHGKRIELPSDDWTMEEFRNTAELLTCDFDGDGVIDQFGFWLPRWVYYLPFLWSFGADLTDDAMTQWTLHGESAEAALRFYRDLIVGDRVAPRDDEVPQLFQDVGFLTAKTAMCVNGPWFMPFLAKTKLADSYIVAPIPRGPGGRVTRITWDGVVVRRGLPPARREAAHSFVRFLLSSTIQRRLAAIGRALPSRRAAVSAFEGDPPDARRAAFVNALSHSRLQPPWPAFGQIDRAINAHFSRLLDPTGDGNVRGVLDRLASDPAIRRALTPRAPNQRRTTP